MSIFPDALVTPVLDTGKRVDEGPPPSLLWTNVGIGMRIASGCFVPYDDEDVSLSYYNALECGPDCEVHARIVEMPTDGLVALYARLDPLTGNGYRLEISVTGSLIHLDRLDAWSDISIGGAGGMVTPFTAEVGGSFRLICQGTTIKGYYKSPGGEWVELVSATDATYSGPGYLAASITNLTDSTGKLENFGGGTLLDTTDLTAGDVYQAKFWLQDDNSAGFDRYVICWYKNGEPIAAGITAPTIQVVQANDGADLVAESAMTQIGATGLYRYDDDTNRVADGSAYIAKCTATIDGATRTWYQPVGRDSF